jgi:hypothetical protein
MRFFTTKNNIATFIFGKTPHFQTPKYNQVTGFTHFNANDAQMSPFFLINGLDRVYKVHAPQCHTKSVICNNPPFFVYLGAFVFIGIMAWRYRVKVV